MVDVAPMVGLDPVTNHADKELWARIARYWLDREYITDQGNNLGVPFALVRITAAGIRHVEEGEQAILQSGPTIHIAGNVYASPIATSGGHIEMQNVFTFGDLDQLIEERGGEERAALHGIAKELRQQLEEHDTLSKEWLGDWLVKHSVILNQHAWILSPLATLLLTWGSGQPLS